MITQTHIIYATQLLNVQIICQKKDGFWCTLNIRRIRVSTIFSDTVLPGWDVNESLELFFQELREDIRNDTHFQQGNASAHTAKHSMWVLRTLLMNE
jgi:hypothetical protein